MKYFELWQRIDSLNDKYLLDEESENTERKGTLIS